MRPKKSRRIKIISISLFLLVHRWARPGHCKFPKTTTGCSNIWYSDQGCQCARTPLPRTRPSLAEVHASRRRCRACTERKWVEAALRLWQEKEVESRDVDGWLFPCIEWTPHCGQQTRSVRNAESINGDEKNEGPHFKVIWHLRPLFLLRTSLKGHSTFKVIPPF